MAKEKEMDGETCNCMHHKHGMHKGGAAGFGGAYGLAFIGAAIYYIQQAPTFWWGVVGFLKALIWPVFVMYHILHMMKW